MVQRDEICLKLNYKGLKLQQLNYKLQLHAIHVNLSNWVTIYQMNAIVV